MLPPVPANSISVAPTITTEVSPSIAPVFHVDTMARSTAHPDDVEERDFYISVSDIITPMDQYLTLSSRTPELVQSLISANAQLQTELRDHQRVIDPAAYTKLSTLSEAVACALVVLNADPEARKGAEEMFFGPDGMGGSVARTARYAREAIRVRTKEMRSQALGVAGIVPSSLAYTGRWWVLMLGIGVGRTCHAHDAEPGLDVRPLREQLAPMALWTCQWRPTHGSRRRFQFSRASMGVG